MIIQESFVRDIARLFIWYPFRWLIRFLPVPIAFSIYRFMGTVHYLLSGGKRKLIKDNLSLVFQEKTLDGVRINTIVRRIFQNHYADRLLIFLLPKLNKKDIDKLVSIVGLENLDSALSKEKGCILLHGHLGPSQLPLIALGLKGYPMNQIGFRTMKELSYIGREVQMKTRLRYEQMIPSRMIPADSFLRPVFESLKNNEILMTAGDGSGTGEFIGKHIPIDFLGQSMFFPIGPISLAIRMGAPILPTFLVKQGSKYKTIIEEPIIIEETGGKDYDIKVNISKFVKRFEEYVLRQPCQWHFWDEFREERLLLPKNQKERPRKFK